MSAMGETFYSLHSGRSHEHGQDLTPYSAVSSFNLPQNCDASLITPVSLTQSLDVNTTTIVGHDMEIKLSPSDSISPTYDMFNIEDEFVETKYNPPMKYKNHPGTLHISTTDSSFPPSPLVPSTPYWGAYGVSATPVSSRSDSTPSMNPSPIGPTMNSISGLSSDGGQPQQPGGAQNYRQRSSVPLLIAPRVPSPTSRQAITPQLNSSYRQNSLQSEPTTVNSSLSTHAPYSERRASMPIRRRRKSPRNSRDSDILLSGDMTFDEQVLMQLTEVDRLPWKEVMVRFRERTGKNMKVPALQMRKKRLVERLRVWTPSDERALTLAFQDQNKLKWDQVAQAMLKYGCVEKWSKEMVQKKWYEMHPEHNEFTEDYERAAKNRLQIGDDFGMDDWSDGINSVSHSLHESDSGQMSAISTATMDEVRSRQASDASTHHLQLQQQHMMFDNQHQQHQQQQNAWNNGNS